jgi:hypothetical protein
LDRPSHSARSASVIVAVALFVVGCGSVAGPSPAASTPPTAAPSKSSLVATPTAPSAASSSPTISAAPATGFAFAAEDVVAYYESQAYVCTPAQPSTKAAGFSFRTCQTVDGAGRTRIVGVVTDPAGALANGFGSVRGRDDEPILAPIDALEPLSGFLGAMLGEKSGGSLVTWLASHLGDEYATTTLDAIKVATYTESADDHRTLFVEVANDTYLDAARP